MKTIKPIKALFVLLTVFASTGYSQEIGLPGAGSVILFDTNPFGGLLGQLEAGSFGDFAASSQWIGIGQPFTGVGSGIKVPAYGFRSQWEGEAGIFALKDAGSAKDLVLEWGSNPDSQLKFSFIRNLANPNSLRDVMTLTSGGAVGIGRTNPQAKLDVFAPNGEVLGVSSILRGGAVANRTGLRSIVTGESSFANVGGIFRAESEGNNAGAVVGVRGVIAHDGATRGIAVQGIARGSGVNNFAGFFVGDVQVNGTVTTPSDRALKEDIRDMPDKVMVDKLMKLKTHTYLYKQEEINGLPKGLQYGFVAQELEKVFPEMVKEVVQGSYKEVENEDGSLTIEEDREKAYKSINYLAMIPILTKAVQEQQTMLQAYEDELLTLREMLTELKKAGVSLPNDSDAIINSLEQNFPNPSNTSSEIRYVLKSSSQEGAAIVVYDFNGQEKLRFDNLKSGKQSITIPANSLKPGVYVYTMMVNGASFDVKRMIISE